MNQPRCVLLAAFALTALIVGPALADSTIDVSLNLRYTDPADPSEGGQFTLVAKTNDAIGIAAISAYMANVDFSSVAMQTGIGAIDPLPQTPPRPAVMQFTSGVVNAVYGQDISTTVVPGVGLATTPAGLIAVDPLKNPAWNNVTSIMTGTFSGTRPAFTTEGSNSTAGNVLTKSTVPGSAAAATLTTTVRGDSVSVDGLLPGDTNRDWTVNIADFATLQNNFNKAGGWNEGDYNDDNMVNIADFAALQNNFNKSATPPSMSVAGVPEPASFLLALAIACGAMALIRRR